MNVMTTPQELVAAGRYLEAARAIDQESTIPQDLRVLRADIEAAIGSPSKARISAQMLLSERLAHRDEARCWEIVGRMLLREGDIHGGLKATAKASDLAQQLQDLTIEARLIASHANTLLYCVGLEAAIAELPRLRRAASRAGDPYSLIEFHLLSAVLSAFRGLLAATATSIDTAQGLLSRYPNLLQEGRLAVLRAGLAAAHADHQEVLRWARVALELSRSSGVRSVQMPALNNLVNALMTQGRSDEAKPFLDELLNMVPDGTPTRLAYRDTQMLLALATGDMDAAAEAAKQYDALLEELKGRDSYYKLQHLTTRVRWLHRRGDVDAAVATAIDAIPLLERRGHLELLGRLRLLAAEGLGRQGRSRTAELMLVDAIRSTKDPSLELVAEGLRVSGRLSIGADPQRAASYFDQARRILAGIGHVAAREEVDRDTVGTCVEMMSTEPMRRLTERIAVFLEFGAHVPTLATGVLAMIRESGAAYQCVVSATDDHGTSQVVDAYTAEDCPQTFVDDGITIDLGSYRTRRFRAHFNSRPTLSDRAMLLGVERLVSAAMAVARDRMRDRQTAGHWPETPPERHLGLICSSELMLELIKTTQRVATSTASVLLTGETGVGKELFAKALHQSSQRSDRTFLPFNCSTVSREMIDSQLFGHRRGSFTGAIGDSAGVIRSAAGGTLFLDEIGEMAIETQPKLLRFLESGEILPLGDTKPQIVDVRIVAATNANLDQLVADGRFREDLYYRLNVIRINIPPLRERREEIPALVEHFLERFGRELEKPLLRVADETLEYLVLYGWPGNVRQLANEIRRLVAMAEPGGVIMPAHLSNEIAESRRTLPANRSPRLFDEVVTRIDQPLSAAVEHIERAAIQRALAMTDGHLDEAARILGLSRKGLYLKRQRLNLG